MSTICAPASAVSNAGIAVVRMSGEDSLSILNKVFKKRDSEFTPRMMYLGKVKDGEDVVDEALAVYFKAPNSYTGEDMVEIQCHGGAVVVNMIMRLLLKNGAEPAAPGEFSKRAFLNGKMDATKAEAIGELIGSLTEKGAKASAKRLSGALLRKINSIEKELVDAMAAFEAGIEYPEEDMEGEISEGALPGLRAALLEMDSLISTYDQGRLLREGVSVAIIGRPNVGKSSLLNAILGEKRAIVSSVAGTTRDIISEYYNLNSAPIKLIDTAGLRTTDDEIEKEGVLLAKDEAKRATITLFVVDASLPLEKEDEDMFKEAAENGTEMIVVLNKTDLLLKTTAEDVKKAFGYTPLLISAKTEDGIKALLDEINKLVSFDDELLEGLTISSSRQHHSLKKAREALFDGISALEMGVDLDCAAIDLAGALSALGEITGKTLKEDVIDRMFEKFCLGK